MYVLERKNKGALWGVEWRYVHPEGGKLPLLVKVLEAQEALSLQVHPSDAMALRYGEKRGKTEMWYVLEAKAGARLYVGFNRKTDRGEVERLVKAGRLEEVLRSYEVRAGDVYYIPSGCVHGLGGGCRVAEIQQESEVTYRLYDYGRKGLDGKLRELQVELGLEAISYGSECERLVRYKEVWNSASEVLKCAYFTTNLLSGEEVLTRSVVVDMQLYIVISGSALVRDASGSEVRLEAGAALAVGPGGNRVQIRPQPEVKILETYVTPTNL